MTYSISQTHCRFLHICVDQYRWKSNRVAPAVHLLPGVSVVVLLSSCACWRPSRYTAMPSYMGIHLWDRSELCCLCRHGEEEGARIRESSQPAAPSSASPCVSRSPGSFQPAPQQPQSQGANAGGWEVLRGLKRTWNSEQSTSSSYMSDCSQWTCCSWSLCPVPVCFQCMWVCAFLCICASVPASVCAVCGGEKKSLPTASLLMLLVAPRWDAEAVWERKRERERRKRCMWEQGRDNGKGDYLKGPLANIFTWN